jgi:calcium-translocating P-type ATPase
MNIQSLPPAEALTSLNSQAQGLDAAEAKRRQAEFGPNQVQRARKKRLLKKLLEQFLHFFALILWVAAALAFYAGSRDPSGGMLRLGWAIVLVILINGVFSFWQEARAERAIEVLEQLLPDRVKVLRGGAIALLPSADLVPGDIILLEGGDRIPADARLLEGQAVQVSMATLTGESQPLARQIEATDELNPMRAPNLLLAGTVVLTGEGKAVVYATGMRTEFGRIAQLTQVERIQDSPLQREIVHLSRIIGLMALGIGVVFFFIGQALHLGHWANLIFAIGIIVANVPEGLLPTVTLALAMAAQRMAKRHALIRRLPAVEALGEATVICTDKTGTLTQNRMEVRQVYVNGAWVAPASLKADGNRAFLVGAASCHTLKARGPGEDPLGDPMEIALTATALKLLGAWQPLERLDLLPFDSRRRRLSVVVRQDGHPQLQSKGALEYLLPLCTTIQRDGQLGPLGDEERQAILAAQEAAADRGLRVLAFATRTVPDGTAKEHLEEDLTFTGMAALEDPPRPDVEEAIRRCLQASIRVCMVTGDHPRTALAIARQIGLVQGKDPRVITGDEMESLQDAELLAALETPELVFARLDPSHKTRIVQAFQRKGEVVAVTGDGVNDAPALRAADIGIAMGLSGTDVARESADLVLADDHFASIVNAVEEGRAIFANVRKFITYILTSNCGELMPFIAFVLMGVPLPLTILQILVIDLGTDMLPALALGAEEPEAESMTCPPRQKGERILTAGVFFRSYLLMGFLEGLCGLAAYWATLKAGGWHGGQVLGPLDPLYLQATAACLSGIIVGQIAAVFMCRSETRSIFKQGILGNRLLLAGVFTEVLILVGINQWGPLQRMLGTGPVPPQGWLAMIPFVAGIVLVEEARKAFRRRAGLAAVRTAA